MQLLNVLPTASTLLNLLLQALLWQAPRAARTSGMHAPFTAPREGAHPQGFAAKALTQAQKPAFSNVA
jgi:hypothetical protein